MQVQIVEQIELFSEVELENLEFVPEELEAIEQERVPDLESIAFEDIAEALEAALEQDSEALLERVSLRDIARRVINRLRGRSSRPQSPPPRYQPPRPRPQPRPAGQGRPSRRTSTGSMTPPPRYSPPPPSYSSRPSSRRR